MHAYLPGWEVQKLRNEMFTAEYGFIVDYLAEILKNLRREDRTHDYTKFFELSSSITTRDKTSIAKTYAGLIKVIYPDDVYSEMEAKEILDFAIENRKRVKDQLRKMDETFEEVDFSYVSKSSGESFDIETLEEIQYKPKPVVSEENEPEMVSNESSPQIKDRIQLNPGQKIIRDNQTGISYDNLFGAYLLNSSNITLVDPYIRLPYQLRNLMEFAKLIAEKKETDAEVKLHLVTSNNEDYIENVKEAFNQMTYSLESMDIMFSYEFDDFIHDRSITSDNGWKIILGRGLDIWQKTGGWYDISEYVQEQRICKACEITFVKG